MFNAKQFYQEFNAGIEEKYEATLTRIREIHIRSAQVNPADEKIEYFKFFNHAAALIIKLANFEKVHSAEYVNSLNFEELYEENKSLYNELASNNYMTSYANPEYCVNVFGDKFGQLISFFYVKIRGNISFAYMHKICSMQEYNELFVKLYDFVKENMLDYENMKKLVTSVEQSDRTVDQNIRIKERFSPEFSFYRDIIADADLTDLCYLFHVGSRISDFEIQTANFLLAYPAEKIVTLSKLIVDAYILGFKNDNKDIAKKSTVLVYYNIGQERLIRQLIKDFEVANLKVLINYAFSTSINKQYQHDHQFDNALYINAEFVEKFMKSYETSLNLYNDNLSMFSGPVFFDKFGDNPFTPATKDANLKLDESQQKMFREMNVAISQISEKFVPSAETSFSIIAFPTPEIGDRFEEIFEQTCEINMLSNEKYSRIQQFIIDALDKADFVHVKGKGENETDIRVKMQTLKNPEQETLFVNCVADVNIPVGEVFTSPQLTGTEGVLHVKNAFLNSYNYQDLKLNFKDGFVEDYSCKNYEDAEKNQKFIEENLLFPHKTLPVGEFAIGTNTLAYAIARKYDIVDILPILIVEKMGPHFAIGDTCFSWDEDRPVYNPDKKEIIARENEKTAKRKENINEAYTNKHIDITLPYDGLDFISAITKDGESIEIIRDGRFVLPGTEELNIPLN
ncbi:MAG: aminopeptidase [Planctomycetes bacterium]|nr:aminopeptidase [Planctomycetota bacterium]